MGDVSIPAWCHSSGGRVVGGCSILNPVVDEQQGASQGLIRQTMTTRCCPWKSIISRRASVHLFLLGVMQRCLPLSVFLEALTPQPFRWSSCGISDGTKASGTVLVNQSRWIGAMTGLGGLCYLTTPFIGASWERGGGSHYSASPSVRHVKLA